MNKPRYRFDHAYRWWVLQKPRDILLAETFSYYMDMQIRGFKLKYETS